PRLSASILNISVSSDGAYYGLIFANNSMSIVNAVRMAQETKVQFLQINAKETPILELDPKNNNLVVCIKDLLQFYDWTQDRVVLEHPIATYTKVTGGKQAQID